MNFQKLLRNNHGKVVADIEFDIARVKAQRVEKESRIELMSKRAENLMEDQKEMLEDIKQFKQKQFLFENENSVLLRSLQSFSK